MMIKLFKKNALALSVSISLLCASSAALADVPISIMGSRPKLFTSSLSIVKTRRLIIQHVLPKLDQSKYLKIQVKPVYKAHALQYFLVYLLSNRTFSFKVMKINVDQQMNFMSMVSHYKKPARAPTPIDDRIEPEEDLRPGHCPSQVIDFVVASPLYSEIPTTKAALDNIAMLAQDKGYHVMKLYDQDATVQSYKNYLSCSNLRGFFSIAHGVPDEILLDDGVLTANYFEQFHMNKTKAMSNAVVEFNSCDVFNVPLSVDMINFVGAKQFIGGNTSLVIGDSENASNCFWTEALMGNDLATALESCENTYDHSDNGFGYGRDIFAIGGFGKDTLGAPLEI